MRKILGLFLMFSAFIFCAGYNGIAQSQAAEKPEAEKFEFATIQGHLLIKDNRLYLKESEEKLYRITDKENPQIYNSLFSLVNAREKENKGLKAVLEGKLGQFGQLVTRTVTYTPTGKVESKKGEEISYTDFALVRIGKTEDVPLEEIKGIKIGSPSYVPPPPPIIYPMQRIQGKVTATYFNKVIPYIEIKDKEKDISKAIIIPADISVIKVVEGQLMSLTPKNVIKEGIKLEIWYEEQGSINIARSINLVVEEKNRE